MVYLVIGNKVNSLLTDVRDILRASSRVSLSPIADKFITVGFGKSLGRPHIGITPDSGDFANLASFKVKIIILTSGRNRDMEQEFQVERIREDVVAEMMDEDNRRTPSNWIIVNYNKGNQSEDPFNSKLLLDEVVIEFKWGGDYEA